VDRPFDRLSFSTVGDVSAPAELVSSVLRVVGAYEATVTAAREAVGSAAAGHGELAKPTDGARYLLAEQVR